MVLLIITGDMFGSKDKWMVAWKGLKLPVSDVAAQDKGVPARRDVYRAFRRFLKGTAKPYASIFFLVLWGLILIYPR